METNIGTQPLSEDLGSVPDVMNDPQFATNTGEDGNGDADTCRICRGEATEQEPLFHPCKCSGSIKFVHQECLMEWLSHSQKKHCELCKTPFRFTKLYSPNMPPTLPVHVFIRHLIVHGFKNFALWLRFCLVVFVWLGCLPWTMRHIWGFLFWFGDGGWIVKPPDTDPAHNSTAMQALAFAQSRLANLAANGTSPASPLLSSPTTSAGFWRIPSFLRPVSQTLNLSASDPLAAGFFKSIYYGLGFQNIHLPGNVSNSTNTSRLLDGHRSAMAGRSSLLSDVQFLKTLTRNPRFNGIIITTLEGQIITIVVVVCFVLVFLIREWVVQQQPGINMGAGFNAEFPAAERGARPRNAGMENAADIEDHLNQAEGNGEIFAGGPVQRAEDIAARPTARPRRRIRFEDEHREDAVGSPAGNDVDHVNHGEEESGEGSSSSARPRMPTRNSQSSATEIQRHLTEESTPRQDRIDAGEFVSVWRRADGNPDEVLRIIEEEGLSAKLGYWKNAMKSLQQANAAAAVSNGQSSSRATISWQDNMVVPEHESGDAFDFSKENLQDFHSPPNFSTQQDGQSFNHNSVDTRPSSGKGKEKATDEKTEPLFDPNLGALPGLGFPNFGQMRFRGEGHKHYVDPSDSSESSAAQLGRSRTTSDGPSPRDHPSPLANSSWSFSGLLSPETPTESQYDISIAGKTQHMAKPESSNQALISGDNDHVPERMLHATDDGIEYSPIEQAATNHQDGPIEVVSNGKSLVADSWDDVFANHPLSDSEDDFDEVLGPEANPFHPDGLLPDEESLPEDEDDETALPTLVEPQGLWGRIDDWLWGDIDTQNDGPRGEDDDDEHIVEDIAAEAPFVPAVHRNGHDPFPENHPDAGDDANEQDQDAVVAALAAGIDPNDPEGLEDAEDFEGFMELVGMRGPLTGLIQNGLFSTVLISLTVACGVWIPYNVGRLALILVANPIPAIKLPLRLLFSLSAVMQDLTLVAIGGVSYALIKLGALPSFLISYTDAGPTSSTVNPDSGLAVECLKLAVTAGERIADGFINAIIQIPDSEVPAFSAVSHESLIHIRRVISDIITYVESTIASTLIMRDGQRSLLSPSDLPKIWSACATLGSSVFDAIKTLPEVLLRSESWVISLESPERTYPLDPDVSFWSGTDRFWAILAGYITFSLLGAAYLRKTTPFSSSQTGREWEATIRDVLNQAGGVMKVILIISIEMLVFPLYCGLLLDVALLPLFDNATISSRILFTVDTPLTSIFVHWFVGTCYMFHFALFVSMCRKIMRSGVLYFIRDPDDPTFHPVRDVLERNVATQLRKITFSAMVYGALVVICLGGVVWSLAFAFPGVLPIHWSSNEPVLEFPIDLLFYNFFMPLAVKFLKPSDGLHAMYAWWFRKCARVLRLTWFLFDERRTDEEGHHVRKTWQDLLLNATGDVNLPVKREHIQMMFEHDSNTPAFFVRDGKYVRTPASDQVRIPKGEKVFLEVTDSNERIDGNRDRDDGLHGRKSELFKMVYIPPFFRLRIFLLILFIWLFAAVTGVCITILPLVFGRHIFARIIPKDIRKNDVYAFSIGIYIVGSVFYATMHVKDGLRYLRKALAVDAKTPAIIMRRAASLGLWLLRLIYAYAAFALVLPALFSLVVEFYVIVPLHTYFAMRELHVIQLVQSWTLGLLYVKLASRFILWHADSRPAAALRAVTRRGYLDPDIRIATRCFILPAVVVLLTALLIPFGLASLVNAFQLFGSDPFQQTLVYRYSYPVCLSMLINVSGAWVLLGFMKGWRMRIRDEVYLIGERLHNFGDRGKSGANGLVPSSSRLST